MYELNNFVHELLVLKADSYQVSVIRLAIAFTNDAEAQLCVASSPRIQFFIASWRLPSNAVG